MGTAGSTYSVMCSHDFISAGGNCNEVINDLSRAMWREQTTGITRTCPPLLHLELLQGFPTFYYPSPSPFMDPLLDWWEDLLVGKHNVEFSSMLALPYE